MAIDLNFYKAVQSVDNWNKDDYREEKEDIAEGLRTSTNYISNAKINDESAELVIIGENESNILKVIAFPDTELLQGDYIIFNNQIAIITEIIGYQPFQISAKALICNYTFKWQDINGNIIKKDGVLSNLSNKIDGNQFPIVSGNTKIYLPYDDDTKYLFTDKRICIGKTYDKNQKEILKVNKIIGSDFTACNYNNGHLVIFDSAIDTYNEKTDNLDLMICDYISSIENDIEKNIEGVINGRKNIPLGSTRNYTIKYIDKNNNSIDNIKTNWSVQSKIKDLLLKQENNIFSITVPDNEHYLDNKIVIVATSDIGIYKYKVGVISI